MSNYRFKSEERDRKLASFILLIFAVFLFIVAMFRFLAAYNQLQLGDDSFTQIYLVEGLGLLAFAGAIVFGIKLWARRASHQIVIDENDPDTYFHPNGSGPF